MSGRIATLERIVKNRQAEKIDGVLVDTLTAHALLMCWAAGNANTKEMIATGDISVLGRSALRVCSKTQTKK